MMKFNRISLILILLLLTFQSYKSQAQEVSSFTILKERNGLPYFYDKLRRALPVTVCYFGGSITEAAGYRVKTEQYFRKRYPHSTITAINAGVGGTGSSLGAFRLQEEVLSKKPDLVFVEFAVNDASSDSLLICRSMEGIVRQIKKQNIHTDICFLYTINDQMIGAYKAGELFRSIRFMERIAEHYKLPSINLGVEVMAAVHQGRLVFQGKKEGNADSLRVFSYDGTHPGEVGHGIYTKTIVRALEKMKPGVPCKSLPKPLYSGNFELTQLLSPNDIVKTPGWQKPEGESFLNPYRGVYPNLIFTSDVTDSVVVHFSGTYFGFCDIIGPSTTPAILVNIDGRSEIRKRFDSYGYFYRRSYCLIGPLKAGNHVVILKKDRMTIDKSTMVGDHETKGDPTDYQKNYFFLGKIMIIGTLLRSM